MQEDDSHRLARLHKRAYEALRGLTSADGTLTLDIPPPSDRTPPPAQIGAETEDGIYIGKHVSECGKVFNLYADKRDFMPNAALAFAAATLGQTAKWDGFPGEKNCDDPLALETALRDGTYGGGWVIPPLEALKKLMDARGEGALAGSFTRSADPEMGRLYWSSTPGDGDREDFFCFDADTGWRRKVMPNERCAVRLVRFVRA